MAENTNGDGFEQSVRRIVQDELANTVKPTGAVSEVQDGPACPECGVSLNGYDHQTIRNHALFHWPQDMDDRNAAHKGAVERRAELFRIADDVAKGA